MTCPDCGTDNPAGARFCMSCGTRLATVCPSCGREQPPEARFCMECGTALAGEAAAPEAAPPGGAEPLPEERRQVTILFADLSGYTAVAERLDPETVKRLVDRALGRLKREVDLYGGTVDKYIGDNVMAVFGAPVAHEDDAERAVRAGLGMQAAMAEINEALTREHGVSFRLRVGVNTGEVLAGAVGESYTVTGDAVNVAARLQAAGEPGMVTVGERTRRATRGRVEYRELAPLELKGKAAPVQAYEALGLASDGRPTPARQSPLVGRERELGALLDLARRTAAEGRPQLVTLVAAAGVGKSRLVREAAAALRSDPEPPAIREGRCPPYGSGIVYWPLAEVMREECGIVDDDPAEVAWHKLSVHLDALLEEAGEDWAAARRRTAAVVGRGLGVEAPGGAGPEEEDPQRMREAFFSAVRAAIEAMARRRALVLVLEDVHWADGGMLDLVEHLARSVRAPLTIVCLAREELLERRPAWGSSRRRRETVLFLEPLDPERSRELVAALLPERELTLARQLAERAGGNPLFAEEMVRRLSEEGRAAVDDLPDTVQAVLAARLDSLEPSERRLVQHAAVVGRTFWQDVLRPAAEEAGFDLEDTLLALQDKDILVPERAGARGDEPELAFKHVLIRDVAYGMLPKSVRARRHFEVGAFLEERAGDRSDEVVALLANHYGRAAKLGRDATLPEPELAAIDGRAVRFLEAAGDAAAALYSNREALAHYRSVREYASDEETRARVGEKQGDIELRLGRVDDAIRVWEECLEVQRGHERLERVGELLRKIGSAHAQSGDRAAAVEHLQRGINLLKDGPACAELVRLYDEAAWLYLRSGDNMLAIYAGEKALRLAEKLGETRAASRAHGIFGRVFGRIGETAKARQNLERAVELARGSDDETETILALLALAQHLEGSEADYDGAKDAYREALAVAERIGDVPAQIELYAGLAWLAVYRADWEGLDRFSLASRELAEREGLLARQSLPLVLSALRAWRAGEWDEAEDLYRRGHGLAEQAGLSEIAFAALFGLGTVLRDRGDVTAAATALDEALDVSERAGLVGRSIQATAAKAVLLQLGGQPERAREAAQEATELAERLNDPVARAAAREAEGATSDPDEAAARLAEGADAWRALGRPLDAARCERVLAWVLRDADPAAAAEARERAARAFEELGVPHLAEQVRAAG